MSLGRLLDKADTTGGGSAPASASWRPRAGDPNGSSERRRDLRELLFSFIRRPAAGALTGTILVYAFFLVAAGGNEFLSANGTATWMNQAAELAIVAIPVGVLMISGEFDLSIASVIGLAALTVSILSGHYELPLWFGILAAFALAACVGLVNGIVTVRTGLPSFIVTLASYLAIGGATLALTRAITTTTNVSLDATGAWDAIFAGSAGQFRVVILWCVGLALFGGYVLSRTVFGNWIFATGGDAPNARGAGVPTGRVKITLFVGSALGAALLGVIQAIQYNGGQVGQGQNFIFDAIVAAVIGGVLLYGGYGSVFGVVCGAATYGIVKTGIYYTGWNADLAQILIGLLVLGAVLANTFLRKLATRS